MLCVQAVCMVEQSFSPDRLRRRAAPKGRAPDPAALDEVCALLGDEPRRRDLLIEHLHRLQDHFGHLSARHLAALAREMNLSQAEVFEVASFYHHFDLVREGEQVPAALTVRVCQSLSCEMAGAEPLRERLQTLLGDGVRVIAAPCIGRCEQAPAVLVGQRAVPRASCEAVGTEVARQISASETVHDGAQVAGVWNPGLSFEPVLDRRHYDAQGGYQLLRRCVTGEMDADMVIAALEDSGLRGLGGAGFPAGRKWRIVRAEPGPRLMAVNIDEGEPGTFKDRYFLEQDPHRFLEGMLIAAWAVGIESIYIYLRDEYHDCRQMLEKQLDLLRADPPIANMPCIELRRGAGAYICGEESAMIESIEGRRGMPRLRPPYVAQVGLFGRPTLEHNFETLFRVREILERGPQWFAEQGRHGRKGLRAFSVSGRVREPGVKLAPAGITLNELINEFCGGMADGHTLYAYLPGGASGGILPAVMADIPLDFDTLQAHGCFIGSAAVIVLSQQDRAVDAARNMMRFFRDESCGQCTPCRVGTAKALALIEKPQWDLELLDELSAVMRDASICGLGQAAPNPVDCVIRYFPQELA
jgi:NADH:ubiquinone oxidoreductase subunit F (NADH-binding)/NADH:ubiquinone oxidoreductase subunit E